MAGVPPHVVETPLGGAGLDSPVLPAVPANPSSRRGAVLVEFGCEGCSSTSALALEQHKGVTYVTWDTSPSVWLS